ncbi:MAG TPA: hypothetical protein VF062_22295 [Candidatus Limnocylindrales bacterium]
MNAPDEPTYTAQQACLATGATYRQVDYWLRARYVDHPNPSPGTGVPRLLTLDQVVQLDLLADLADIRRGRTRDIIATLLVAGEFRMGSISLRYDRVGNRRHIVERLEGT